MSALTPGIAQRDVTVYQGTARAVLEQMPAESVQCIVTSPPYYGLRDYGVAGQIGLEATPAEYVAAIVDVMDAARRVLARDGVLWLNIGDSYSGKANGGPSVGPSSGHSRPDVIPKRVNTTAHAPYKSLLLIPARVSLALVDAGWTVRNDIVWHKPNATPESVRDRVSCKWEHLFLLTRHRRYQFDIDAIKVPASGKPGGNTHASLAAYGAGTGTEKGARRFGSNAGSTLAEAFDDRNPGDVWTIPTYPFPGAHFATMAPALARRCVLAGSREGQTVCDPFTGSGTTAMVARQLGRPFVGAELNPDYFPIIERRIGAETLELGAGA